MPFPVGEQFNRESQTFNITNVVTIVLEINSGIPGGWNIVTAYPGLPEAEPQ